MQVTGSRNAFGVHSAAYYRRAFELFAPDHAALLLASYEGQDLAGLMVFALGETAWYFYGASSNAERERMPTYALQWEAIRWARERGCTIYDLWGIPDEDEATLEAQFQTRSDGLWGVYGFKRGFGGTIARSVGAWDRVYNPLLYAMYSTVVRSRSAE
jgi:peptidoglycan pentaglycine glycine transferase (the first glycine)